MSDPTRYVSDPIRGQVASLLTTRELVLNRGSEHGVQKGMKFAVLNPRGLDVADPETGKPIGSVDLPKVIVEVSRVEPRLSVAKTFRQKRVNVGGSGLGGAGLGIASLFEPPQWVEKFETLRTTEKPQSKEIDPKESYVQVGDPVVEVRDDEYVLDE